MKSPLINSVTEIFIEFFQELFDPVPCSVALAAAFTPEVVPSSVVPTIKSPRERDFELLSEKDIEDEEEEKTKTVIEGKLESEGIKPNEEFKLDIEYSETQTEKDKDTNADIEGHLDKSMSPRPSLDNQQDTPTAGEGETQQPVHGDSDKRRIVRGPLDGKSCVRAKRAQDRLTSRFSRQISRLNQYLILAGDSSSDLLKLSEPDQHPFIESPDQQPPNLSISPVPSPPCSPRSSASPAASPRHPEKSPTSYLSIPSSSYQTTSSSDTTPTGVTSNPNVSALKLKFKNVDDKDEEYTPLSPTGSSSGSLSNRAIPGKPSRVRPKPPKSRTGHLPSIQSTNESRSVEGPMLTEISPSGGNGLGQVYSSSTPVLPLFSLSPSSSSSLSPSPLASSSLISTPSTASLITEKEPLPSSKLASSGRNSSPPKSSRVDKKSLLERHSSGIMSYLIRKDKDKTSTNAKK